MRFPDLVASSLVSCITDQFCFGLAATKVVSHLIEKLPGSAGDKWPPTDVVVNIIAVLNNLVVESPIAARDIVYFDGLRKLFYIKRKRDRCELPLPPNPGLCLAI